MKRVGGSFVGSVLVSGGDEFMDDSLLGAAVASIGDNDEFCLIESFLEIVSGFRRAYDVVSSLDDDGGDMCDFRAIIE